MAGSATAKYRTIREDPAYTAQAQALAPNTQRLDEILEGLVWAVCTEPSIFPLMRDTGMRLVKTDPYPGALPLRIFFTWDEDDNCTLCWIELIEDLPEEQDFSG